MKLWTEFSIEGLKQIKILGSTDFSHRKATGLRTQDVKGINSYVFETGGRQQWNAFNFCLYWTIQCICKWSEKVVLTLTVTCAGQPAPFWLALKDYSWTTREQKKLNAHKARHTGRGKRQL